MSPRQFLASFDVEDWFHGIDHWFGTANPPSSTDWTPLEARVERNTHQLLDILAEAGARSTLFVLGWIARRYPALVRRMVAEGHEVASHTDMHRLLYTLSAEELVDDLARARDTLEQLTGAPVWGIRAPTFSISETGLRDLAEAGYWYDSSLFPFTAHRRYGKIPGVADPDQPVLELMPGLLELPMSRVAIGPLRVPWAGGAYFPLIPLRIVRRGVGPRTQGRCRFFFYFHPRGIGVRGSPPPGVRPLPKVRPYTPRP